MRRALFLILVLSFSIDAINGYTLYKRYQQGDTAKASGFTANWDSGQVWSGKLVDTLDRKFVRFTDFKDSTIDSVKAKKLTSTGVVTADSVFSTKSLEVQGSFSGGALRIGKTAQAGRIRFARGTDGGYNGYVGYNGAGVSDTFEIYNSSGAGQVVIQGGNPGGNVLLAKDQGRVAVGGTGPSAKLHVRGSVIVDTNLSVDSLYSTKGIRATNFTGNLIGNATGNLTGNVTGGTISGTTGAFSSTVAVDSLYSTKSVVAKRGVFDSAKIGPDYLGFAIDTGRTDGTGAASLKNLPTGFTSSNCQVLSTAAYISGLGTWETVCDGAYTFTTVTGDRYNVATPYANAKYRVVFLKTSK